MTMPLPKSAPVCSRAQLRRTRMAKRRAKQRKPENTQGQDAIFRGTSGGDASSGRGLRISPSAARRTQRAGLVLGEELANLADRDPRIVVLTADLANANRTNDFRARHPDRFFNLGIAEKNMMTIAAGMASCGMVAYAATFASFCIILGAEQAKTDCAYPAMKVRLVGHHSGMSMGFYGTSHQPHWRTWRLPAPSPT
jgi:transketolase